jgi:hypothetical protein
MSVSRPDETAAYHEQAEQIRTLAAQIPVLEIQLHLFEAAQQLEELAAGAP